MNQKIATLGILFLLAFTCDAFSAETNNSISTNEINRQVWDVIVETVSNADIVKMGATYATDAVLVSPAGTNPIKNVLQRWGQDMQKAKKNGSKATVAFRFSHRQDNAETAFESGLFQYTVIDKAGIEKSGYYPFEQLLIKQDGSWRILMEHQLPEASKQVWDALPY